MSEPILFDYQLKAEIDISSSLQKFNKVLCVSPGASGKTIMSASITKKWHVKQIYNTIQKQGYRKLKVAFFTHREELFNQTREKMLLFGNITEPININTSHINPNADTFVCMVETFYQRSDSTTFLSHFKDVGLVFIDEAHRTDFDKIIEHFPNAKFIGWTATPISADKKNPLNKVWDTMIEIATVTQLQSLNLLNPKVGVIPSDCYQLSGIDRSKLQKKGQEFDEKKMSIDFRDKKQKTNTIEKYYELGAGMKGLCFNCDIEHNEQMHQEFLSLGIPSRQLHSDRKKWYGAPTSSLAKNWRKDTLIWLKETSGAIVHNVGILTTGFDEPSIELIMVNRSTLSISLWIQMIVRGARPFQYPNGEWKEFYRLLDFGQNASYFQSDGNNDINWQSYFDMPHSTHHRDGVGGYKSCPDCGNLNPVAARFCQGMKKDWLSQEMIECGHIFPVSEKEIDEIPRVMIKFISDGINVSNMIGLAKLNGYSLGSVYFRILDIVCEYAKKGFGTFILSEQFNLLLDIAFKKIRELGKVTGKKVWRDSVKKGLIEKLRKEGFVLDIEEVGDSGILEEIKNQK